MCVRIRVSFSSIVSFSFSDELVRPDMAGIFSRRACLWGQHHVHAVEARKAVHTCDREHEPHGKGRRRLSVVNRVWTIGIPRGIFIAPGCPESFE